jgi:hypothetical protein
LRRDRQTRVSTASLGSNPRHLTRWSLERFPMPSGAIRSSDDVSRPASVGAVAVEWDRMARGEGHTNGLKGLPLSTFCASEF